MSLCCKQRSGCGFKNKRRNKSFILQCSGIEGVLFFEVKGLEKKMEEAERGVQTVLFECFMSQTLAMRE